MNKNPNSQQGITLISMILGLVILGFFVLLILKVGPIYLDHTRVTSALNSVKESAGLEAMGESEIRAGLTKRFDMNYVKYATDKDAKIAKRGNYLKIEMDYEVVEKILGNLSVLVEFHDVVEVGKE